MLVGGCRFQRGQMANLQGGIATEVDQGEDDGENGCGGDGVGGDGEFGVNGRDPGAEWEATVASEL